MKNNPIGIFDSGLGGLTVASAIVHLLPQENIVYLGDTHHLPWGDKSDNAIKHYSEKICEVLISQLNCKIVVVACNTASAIAYDVINAKLKDKVQIINVIDPMIEHLAKKFDTGNIGLIGTRQTVKSCTYHNKLKARNPKLNIKQLQTPLLVPLIEEDFITKEAMQLILAEYLDHVALSDIQALILGCTHYPLLKNLISKHYKNKIPIIDGAQLTALSVQQTLSNSNLLATNEIATKQFLITDYNDFFAKIAQRFFKEPIELKEFPMW